MHSLHAVNAPGAHAALRQLLAEQVWQISADRRQLKKMSEAMVQQAMACRSVRHPEFF